MAAAAGRRFLHVALPVMAVATPVVARSMARQPDDGRHHHPCSAEGRFVPGCFELKIFSGTASKALAEEVAALLGVEVGQAIVSQFADGETNIQILQSVRGKDCYVIQSAHAPVNDRIMELLLFVSTLHRASAKKVTAVIPYYGYKHHHRMSAVSSDKKSRFLGSPAQDVAHMLEVAGVDMVLSVDLQRPGNQQESTFFNVPVEMAMTDGLGVEHFSRLPALANERVTVVAPNPDTARKAQIFMHGLMDAWRDPTRVSLALFSRAPVVNGTRIHTESQLLGDVKGSVVVMCDDLIDTGHTLIRAAQVAKEQGAKSVYVWASHGIFTADALEKIERCENIHQVVVTNTCPLPASYDGSKVTQLSVGPLIAKLIMQEHFKRHLYNEQELINDPEEVREAR